MWFVRGLLLVLALGIFGWTVIQAWKPAWFYAAEESANLKRTRPRWYLVAGILGLVSNVLVWYQAITLKLTSVWILAVVISLGSIKSLGMVFFYDQFSEKVSGLVGRMNESKTLYRRVVISRGLLSVLLLLATAYFWGYFGELI